MLLPEGIDIKAFETAMSLPPVVSVKLNRRKCSDVADIGYGALQRVPWCDSGYYLELRPVFTLNPLLHSGLFYVQDASSMIYETIVSRLRTLGLIPLAPLVIDLCAAPGGKTTSMINALPDDALVIANEVVPKRAAILQENILKWGFPGVTVTNSSVSDVAALGPVFDLVAVDAPCSGEGMMRKDAEAVAQWSPALVTQCAVLQREILPDAVSLLKPGGILIYSTCTFNRTENEENVEWLVDNFGLKPLDMDFPEEWGIGSQIASPYPAMRFMPHITRGEGLFVAVFQKPVDSEGLSPEVSRTRIADKIANKLRVLRFDSPDTPKTKAKGKKAESKSLTDRPDPVAPLSLDFNPAAYPVVDLSEEDALSYLRHEALRLPPETPLGYVVVTFRGNRLGFVKNIGSRANNLYPSRWKIRMK